MGSGGGDSENTIRYAPYLENAHSALIAQAQSYREATKGHSPYAALTFIDPVDAFFGVGYVVSQFPAVYDMFGKFEAGLDIETLWTQEVNDSIYGAVIQEMVSAEAAYLDDQLENVSIPRMEMGLSDMNAVMSSAFVVGRELLEADRTKAINKYQADLRAKALELGQDRWKTHLTWNQEVIKTYMSLTQLYLAANLDYTQLKGSVGEKNTLWPFTVLDAERAIIGALNGAAAATNRKENPFQSAMSGLFGGAAAGAKLGAAVPFIGPEAGVIGGALFGLLGGLF